MKVTETILEGCFVLEPKSFKDNRGVFYESYQKERFEELLGTKVNFVQDNVSVSKKGVVRGLHYQKGKYAQAKLVQVLKGSVLDVVVDLRKESNTFGKHFKMEISSENRKAIFIPKGCAHGFLALTEDVIFSYKCDHYYHPEAEAGILFKDPNLNIDWELPEVEMILSEKDLELPLWKELEL
ncbi:dTDP-4-dehydrorhamnose 3,5-epimerase [Arenibacter sp. 6A1]|uniref:dTDP-4-dehydrorhamnose 3,5-epimerase n=1 Tax=Arenibacter sp. 6A1 TaxID=2720391 RepID=UPI0014476BF1|nr:dTDP-4-dehydrorhamnose 3,5-epimerase [Arenibacter sp. 6A1]NKI26858.1 dTDP-4-dehydrorhamnose 3,5-epimerase [Arenibacter sp. 6A1]